MAERSYKLKNRVTQLIYNTDYNQGYYSKGTSCRCMESSNSAKIAHDTHDGSTKDDTSEPVQLETVMSRDTIEVNKGDTREHGNVGKNVGDMDVGDVNMEASISADDVMRAGGYGARDDISSFLPVASDSTDFEASLRDARDYEEPQKDICRPGLGWKHQD